MIKLGGESQGKKACDAIQPRVNQYSQSMLSNSLREMSINSTGKCISSEINMFARISQRGSGELEEKQMVRQLPLLNKELSEYQQKTIPKTKHVLRCAKPTELHTFALVNSFPVSIKYASSH